MNRISCVSNLESFCWLRCHGVDGAQLAELLSQGLQNAHAFQAAHGEQDAQEEESLPMWQAPWEMVEEMCLEKEVAKDPSSKSDFEVWDPASCLLIFGG